MPEALDPWEIKTMLSDAQTIFQPILEEIAKDVAKDTAKSFVGKCFQKVYSVIYREPLTQAVGEALKALLKLIEDELLDAGISDDEVENLIPHVKAFLIQPLFEEAVGRLFLEPDYVLDSGLLAGVWQTAAPQSTLPDDFSWSRIAQRFGRAVAKIRASSSELEATFRSLATAQNSEALKDMAGLSPDFDLDTYREALVERYGRLNLDSLDTSGSSYDGVRLWRIFVPQTVRESRGIVLRILELPKEHVQRLLESGEIDLQMADELEREKHKNRQSFFDQPLRPVLDVCNDSALNRIVILGDPGAGKSSLLRYLALQWAYIENATERYTQPLPLLIELREYNRWECPNGKDFISYLHHASTWHRFNQHTLHDLFQKPDRVVLLLDGLDEVFDPNQREQVINDIHRFSNEYKATRIIMTSRVVGYKPQRLRDAEFRDFKLEDLTADQIQDFLERWHRDTFDGRQGAARRKARLEQAIAASKAIAMLAGNPLLLTMMANLNLYQELPRDRSKLYENLAEVLLQKWDTERALEGYTALQGQVDLRAKREILQRVARAMQDSSSGLAGNIIHGDRLIDLIEDYLQQELDFQQARAAARAVVKQLRERNFILCYLGADSYAFVHRTFLEYFCAVDFVQRFKKEMSMDEAELIAFFDQHCRADEWREVLRLICGQIDEQFVGKIVLHLANRTDLNQWDGKSALPEFPLAIWALSEVRNVARLEGVGKRLMEQTILLATRAGHDGAIQKFMLEDMTVACRGLGERWPGHDKLRQVALSQIDLIPIGGYGKEFWPIFVAHVIGDRNLVHQLARHTRGEFSWAYRCTALLSLAERWPDERTRVCLTRRAVDDEDELPRSRALSLLAEKWPNKATRKFLREQAIKDESEIIRCRALSLLVEKWPDEDTRVFLTQRAEKDTRSYPRSRALSRLAERWPGEDTRVFLTQRAAEDENYDSRRTAAFLAAKQHSRFGQILFTCNLNGFRPYLDPREGITQEHIEGAAQKSGIHPDEIEAQVESLSEYLGWDIRKGSSAGTD